MSDLFTAMRRRRHPENETAEMPLIGHLEELRHTLIRMALCALAGMLLCFGFAPSLMQLIRRPVDMVLAQRTASFLPDGVSPEEWRSAGFLLGGKTALPPGTQAELELAVGPRVAELTQARSLLVALQALPGAARDEAISRSGCSDTVQSLTRALAASGAGEQAAVLGVERTRLMGAFQPGEAFMLSVQLAFFGGVVLVSPLLLYFLLQFIMPGLLQHERRLLRRCLVWGVGLFLLGCSFAYFAVLPRVLGFFYDYSAQLGISNDWRISYYLSFSVKLILVFGLIFELPVVLWPLMKLGILTRSRMRRLRSYMLVGSFGTALLLAPAPDPGTMLLMALPLYLLYELCILLAPRERVADQSSSAEE